MSHSYIILDKALDVPLHLQLYRCMKNAIRSGHLASGDRCPTEAELTRFYDISRPVIQQAYAQLMEEHLIYRQKGRGTFVSSKSLDFDLIQSLLPMTKIIEQNGWDPSVKTLKSKIQKYDCDRMGTLNLGPEDDVLTLQRIYYADHEPITYFNVYLPLKTYPNIETLDLENGPLYAQLNAHYPQRIHKAFRSISAIILDDEVSRALKVPKDSASFRVENTNYNAEGLPLFSSVHYLKGLGMNVSLDYFKIAREVDK